MVHYGCCAVDYLSVESFKFVEFYERNFRFAVNMNSMNSGDGWGTLLIWSRAVERRVCPNIFPDFAN